MCLRRLVPTKTRKKEFKVPKDEKGLYAWKCFTFITKEHASPLWHGYRQQVGKWIKEEDYRENKRQSRISNSWGENHYATGFHLYLKRNLNEGRVCKKVRVRKIVAKGYQDGRECIVCKEIFIPVPRKIVL